MARGSGAGGPRFCIAGTRLRSRGPTEFGWVARGFGAGGPRSLDGWHAAQELGARGFGWVVQLGAAAQELGARRWIGGTRRGVWMGGTGPPVLDGWHAAQFGCGTRLRSWRAHKEFGWVRDSGAGGP